ncbi:MAG: glycoside hydrolase family 95 protein, partial [Bacteroidaceae bacterium]|nr:glycoside hydrolase family 95 protein [Bacteroidaceae bacterium]
LTATTIHSSVGGTLRIRSYVPLKGEGLKKAEGNCPNSFLASSAIKDPIVSKKITAQLPLLYNCYEYDVETIAGKDYHFERAER